MIRRVISFLLALVLTLGLLPTVQVSAEEEIYRTSQEAVELLKQMEGFAKYPYYDYSQYTVGYGTRCPDEDYARYARDGITEEEAEQLLITSLDKVERTLTRFATNKGLTWTQNQVDALILFSYNCGTAWLYQPGTFHSAVVDGKTGEDFLYAIALWCYAGGSILPGLVNRRLCEANIYINGEYSNTPPENYCYVYYNAQGGTVASKIEAYDANVGHGPTVFVERSGFTFGGWYTAKSGGEEVTVLDRSTSGKTLYARWISGDTEDVVEPTEPTTPTEPEEPAEPMEPVTVTVLAELNIRSGAGTGYNIVGSLEYGTKVVVTEVKSAGGYTWGKIEQGWICLYYTNYESVMDGSAEDTDYTVITGKVKDTNNLRIRSGPGFSYSIVGYLSLNTPVEIMERRDADGMTWGKISQGWISMDYVAIDGDGEEEPPAEVLIGIVVNSSFLRIRSGPGFSYGVVGLLDGGDEVEITEQKYADGMNWGHIAQGWVSMDYIELKTDNDPEEEKPEQPTEPEKPEGTYGTVINASFLRIRSGAGLSYDVVGYLYSGNRVFVTDRKDADGMTWGRIEEGWISLDYVSFDSDEGGDSEEETSIQGTIVNCEDLRVRSGPGTTYSIEGYIKCGDTVTITKVTLVGSTRWGYIGWGWISMDYFREGTAEEEPGEDTPAEEPTENVMTGIVVDTGELRVRSGAGLSYSVVGYVFGGSTVKITAVKNVDGMIWGKIENGWISLDYVELYNNITPTGTKICIVNTDYLNVRSGAGINYEAITYYVRGDRVEVLEETAVDGVSWGRTAKGWICMDYVK